MDLSKYEIYKGKNAFSTSRVLLDAEWYIGNFTQETRELLGSGMNLTFEELGYDDDCKNSLREFLKTTKANGFGHYVTVIGDRENRPRLMDLAGTYHDGEDLPYEITLWDIADMEADYNYFRDNMWKYRAMISMTNAIFFDYEIEKDIISFFRYVSKKSIRVFYGSIDEFEKSLLAYAEQTDKNLLWINQLVLQLKTAKNSIDVTVQSGFLHMDHKVQTLHFRAGFNNIYGHRIMCGVVNDLMETESDVPYYMTNAGLDSVTGLLSKRSLIEYTEHVFTNPATAARIHYMVLLDIDDFKSINDNYGHQVGDQMIQLLASTMIDVVREAGIVGRYGGDEFYILTDMITEEDELRSLLRNIRGTLEIRAKEELGLEKITLSMGVSKYPEQGKSYKDLLQLADKCLYIAKERGKNRYIIYRPQMHAEVQTGANARGISSYDEQSKAINQAVHAMFRSGKDAIESTMPDMVRGFDLDSMDVIEVRDKKRIYTCGKYDSGLEWTDFIHNKKYRNLFNDSGLMVLNNYNTLKKPIPEIYELLDSRKCMSVIQLALPTVEEPHYFISFNMMNRNHKWSDAEISNLGLYGSLIYELMCKEE